MSVEPLAVESVLDEAEVTEVPAPTESVPVPEPETADAEASPDEPACESILSEEQQQSLPTDDIVLDVPKDEPEVEHADTIEAPPIEPTADEADPTEPVVVVPDPEVSELSFDFVLRNVNMY